MPNAENAGTENAEGGECHGRKMTGVWYTSLMLLWASFLGMAMSSVLFTPTLLAPLLKTLYHTLLIFDLKTTSKT